MGELEPLPIPKLRWDTISVDFIIELPEAHRYDAVMNVLIQQASKPILSQKTQWRLPLEQLNSIWLMSGSCMAFQSKLYHTEAPNLSPSSPVSFINFSEASSQRPQPTTCRVMVRQSKSIRSWNNTFEFLSMNIRMTGTTSLP